MVRLRRTSSSSPGWARTKHGRGFRYLDQDGAPLEEIDVERCKKLVIPPAWTEVWICPVENGHLQAVGSDDAGRRSTSITRTGASDATARNSIGWRASRPPCSNGEAKLVATLPGTS